MYFISVVIDSIWNLICKRLCLILRKSVWFFCLNVWFVRDHTYVEHGIILVRLIWIRDASYSFFPIWVLPVWISKTLPIDFLREAWHGDSRHLRRVSMSAGAVYWVKFQTSFGRMVVWLGHAWVCAASQVRLLRRVQLDLLHASESNLSTVRERRHLRITCWFDCRSVTLRSHRISVLCAAC